MVSVRRRLGSTFAALSLLIPITTFLPPTEDYVVIDKPLTQQLEVYDTTGEWIATFTHGTQTVLLAGAQRTFSEPTAAAPVITSLHIRLLPTPFTGDLDQQWLHSARTDTTPDILDMAAQYVQGAPDQFDTSGLRIAGDADYGAISADGTTQAGADFNDYLGIDWQYPGKADVPEADQLGALDCSGFIRMLFGYRGGMAMSISPTSGHLPRRTFQMFEDAPGRLIHTSATQLTSFNRIQPGDLVFFDATPDFSGQIDHVGMFLGIDTNGKHRFISSRKSAAGPTIGDMKGRSTLNGTGYYAEAFRGIRRL
jgi:cell wall-associated NlpC family hydrolase